MVESEEFDIEEKVTVTDVATGKVVMSSTEAEALVKAIDDIPVGRSFTLFKKGLELSLDACERKDEPTIFDFGLGTGFEAGDFVVNVEMSDLEFDDIDKILFHTRNLVEFFKKPVPEYDDLADIDFPIFKTTHQFSIIKQLMFEESPKYHLQIMGRDFSVARICNLTIEDLDLLVSRLEEVVNLCKTPTWRVQCGTTTG